MKKTVKSQSDINCEKKAKNMSNGVEKRSIVGDPPILTTATSTFGSL